MRLHYFLSVFLFASVSAAAQSSIDYHPNGVVRLGFGYDPQKPTVPFVSACISHEGSENIDAPGGIAIGSVEVSEVSDRRSLLETVGVAASMEAHSAMFSGGASFSQTVGVSFDESTLVWVARIKVNFGRYRLRNPVPTQLLAGAANAVEAKSRCGPEIVTQESRGGVAAVVYEVHNLTNSEKQELSAALNASYKGPNAGASFDSAYSKVAKKVQSRTNIKTYVHVQGGPGKEALARFVSATDLAAVRAALTKYGGEVTTSNNAPLTYQTSPLSQFSNLTFKAPPNLVQDRLWEIYSQYENLTTLIRRINALVKPTAEDEAYLVKYVNPAQRTELNEVRALYEQGRSALKASAAACLTGKASCMVPLVIGRLPRVTWPPIPPGLSIVGLSNCNFNLAGKVGGPPLVAGQRLGVGQFRLGLTGDRDLFDSVWLLAPDSRVPIAPLLRVGRSAPIPAPAGASPSVAATLKVIQEAQILLEVIDGPDPLNPLFEHQPGTKKDCTIRENVDRNLLFGGLVLNVDLRKDVLLGSVEVVDKLGRRSIYELDKFE